MLVLVDQDRGTEYFESQSRVSVCLYDVACKLRLGIIYLQVCCGCSSTLYWLVKDTCSQPTRHLHAGTLCNRARVAVACRIAERRCTNASGMHTQTQLYPPFTWVELSYKACLAKSVCFRKSLVVLEQALVVNLPSELAHRGNAATEYFLLLHAHKACNAGNIVCA